MNILVVGGGGREHAIVKKLKESKKAEKIYVLPGNGGIESDAECVPVKATDLQGIVRFAERKKVDFAVVAPDDPLVMGCVDLLEERGIP
ncbi:MAG: phosphoribosylamine--glycine ligase family protein, partial [Clostridiales bacterium]|nr:phosphoribosylamine--glycine ligase family protein [Clostridiales bacterium]